MTQTLSPAARQRPVWRRTLRSHAHHRDGHDCRRGTPLSFEFLDSDSMDLAVGSLDDPTAVSPTEHFAVETRIEGWHVRDGLPDTRIDSHLRIQQRWREAYGANVMPGLAATRNID